MKYKSIASICKKAAALNLIDKPGDNGYISQWVGDGSALYPVIGLPYMETEHVCAAFEYPDKLIEKMRIDHTNAPAGICLEDTWPGEIRLNDDNIHVVYAGHVLKPLEVTRGLAFIDTSYLSPLSDIWPVMEFFEWVTPNGGTYIAVKAGLLLYAIIFPYDVLDKTFVAKIETLAYKCRTAFDAKAAAIIAASRSYPPQMTVDPETGEVTEPPDDEGRDE